MFDSIMTFAEESQNTGTSFIETACWIATVVGLWKMFEKAGEPGWPALIPFYDTYNMCEICMGNPWYWLRLFVAVIPFVGWIAAIYFAYQMYRAVALSYGKPESWAWGLLFLGPVFMCIIGFGDSDYYGPMGAGDTRNRDAREARTVNFEVTRDSAHQQDSRYSQDSAADHVQNDAVKKEDEEVDFFFDQPEE